MKIMTRILLKLGLITRIDWLRSRGMTIGNGCVILDEVRVDPGFEHLVTMGDQVTIAPEVFLLAHDASTRRSLGVTRERPIRIGDRVFIGSRALILPGVTIGNDAVIGAGSVVTHDVPANSVACGNPAMVKSDLASFLRKRAVS